MWEAISYVVALALQAKSNHYVKIGTLVAKENAGLFATHPALMLVARPKVCDICAHGIHLRNDTCWASHSCPCLNRLDQVGWMRHQSNE